MDLFGELQQGTADEPAVFMETPPLFQNRDQQPAHPPRLVLRCEQQGEGIADVTTHLIDQLFWKCFPIR